VSFEKIEDQLGFEAKHRVPDTAGRLIAAVRAGAYSDFEARPNFYGNHVIFGLGGDPAAVGEASDGAD
jgi:hypothetical protein